jgi:ATP-dependent DNA helicase HFM1/MER3
LRLLHPLGKDRPQGRRKVVYIGPLKALCQERFRDWSAKFKPHHVKCAEITGDTDMSAAQDLEKADILITTPGTRLFRLPSFFLSFVLSFSLLFALSPLLMA